MKEDCVSFELAKKLREKGYYYEGRNIYDVLKWLREEKYLYVSPSLFHIGYRPYIQSTLFENDKTYTDSWFLKSYYSSYEEAAIAGIGYILDNLI